jgi:hypothetical protein
MNNKMNLGALLRNVVCGVLFLTQPTFAALIDVDWQTSGDAKLLFDASTGMQWLDLSMTANRSYNQVIANLGPGEVYDGFRVATQAEVLDMWSHAGITNYERLWTVGQYPAVNDLVTRLGPTTMVEPGLFPVATHTIGMFEGDPSLPANERWAAELTYAPDGESSRTSVNFYTWNVGAADDHYSTYLVRPVPLPAAIWLLMSGALSIGALQLSHRRRRKRAPH